MQGIFRKENTDKALKYGIYRHLPTYEKIIRNLVSFYIKKNIDIYVTGSNAYMLSSEIATMISGRYIQIEMLPLSFKEYMELPV